MQAVMAKLPQQRTYVGNLIPYDRWLEEIDVSRVTGWEYRKRGWVVTIKIAGRNYITREEIARFHIRAEAGEFVKRTERTVVLKNP